MADEKTKATLLFDVVGYRDGDQTIHADKTETPEIELSKSELERLEALGAVAKSGTKAAKQPVSNVEALTALKKDELEALADQQGVDLRGDETKAEIASALDAAGYVADQG
jgi:hypothetical protein